MINATEAKQADRAHQSGNGCSTGSEPDRDAVLAQLERLLASSAFRSSKRVSSLLRYVVEQTLDNGGAELKERTIGVRVFGRPPDYDTSAEPVVRVSAGDLRKRIAQYYHEAGHENDVRIDLPTGSYHPIFYIPSPQPVVSGARSATDTPTVPALEIVPPPTVEVPKEKSRKLLYTMAAGLAAALVIIGIAAAMRMPGNAYDQFWEPVISEKGTALVYAPEGRQGENRIVFEDALALVDLTGTLRVQKKPYRVLQETELMPETLKQGPALLIGGFSNPLARRLTQQLRFTFASEGDPATTGFAFIQDRQNLNRKDWAVPRSIGPNSPTFTDYAIVSRVVDPVTDRIAVVSAGIRRFGTQAAAEFLSDPQRVEALTATAPRDWRKKNMQAVLTLDVKDNRAGPAKVVATYFW